MSVKGLEQSEAIARGVTARVKKSLDQTAGEVQAELDKIKYLLTDREAAQRWASNPANAEKLAQIRARMDEVEQLYLQAGDTTAARIFKQRTEAALKQRLTNLQAAQVDLSTMMAKSRCQTGQQISAGLTEVRQEGILTESYTQARRAGGFLSNFGRPHLEDVVTLETKAAGSKTIGKYMAELYTRYEAQIKSVFIDGIVRGDSYETMAKGLEASTGLSKRKAQLIVNTEANAIFNESVMGAIKDNPLVKGYRFRAVLDSRTSKICQEHDGEYIPKEDIKPGVNFPPLHPNCRSTVTTVLYNEDERKDTMQRYTKNGSNQWEEVPPGMTYQEYKDRFGFANSKNPRTYNPATRDIHDTTLARVTPTQYKGYVKPSRSATARIRRMVEAYQKRNGSGFDYMADVADNTFPEHDYKALADAVFRQAQAESGFDGLPLSQPSSVALKDAEKNGYTVMYRKFRSGEDREQFVSGAPFESVVKEDEYRCGTTLYSEKPEDMDGVTVVVVKSPSTRVLRIPGNDRHSAIRYAMTGDKNLNAVLRTMNEQDRIRMFPTLAVQYGYDGVEFPDGSFSLYNRTAAVVAEPEPEVVLPKAAVEEVSAKAVKQVQELSFEAYQEKAGKAHKFEWKDPNVSRPFRMPRDLQVLPDIKDDDPDALLVKRIRRYTGCAYEEMNAAARSAYFEEGYDERDLDEVDYIASQLYDKATKEDMVVWRDSGGVRELQGLWGLSGYDEDVLEKILYAEDDPSSVQEAIKEIASGDKVLTFDQLESTELVRGAFSSPEGRRVEFEIFVPEGTPGAYLGYISDYEHAESEFLFPPGISAKIRGVSVDGRSVRMKLEIIPSYSVPKSLSRTYDKLQKMAVEGGK